MSRAASLHSLAAANVCAQLEPADSFAVQGGGAELHEAVAEGHARARRVLRAAFARKSECVFHNRDCGLDGERKLPDVVFGDEPRHIAITPSKPQFPACRRI